jgi:hypothetical protein
MWKYLIAIQEWLSPSIGGGGDNGGNQSTTTTVTPWAGVQPSITNYLNRAESIYKTPFQFNQGDTIAPFSPEQQYALSGTTQRALQGSPNNLAAQGNNFGTLTGQYMSPDSNPWLKANVDTALDDVQTRVNSQFNNNNFGSSAHQETLARNLGQTAAGLYGDNYQQERGRQMQASALAPSLAETDYRDMQALAGVGDTRRGLAQDYLNQANSTVNSYYGYPQQKLDNFGRAVQTGMGVGSNSTSTSPNPYQSNPIAGAIGGGLAGYSLGSQIGSIGGPWGAVGGAVLGGLLG